MSAQGEAMSADEWDIILGLKNKLSEKHILDTHEMVVGATLRLIELALSAPSPAATVAEGEPVAWQYLRLTGEPDRIVTFAEPADEYRHRYRPLYAPSGPADARVRELEAFRARIERLAYDEYACSPSDAHRVLPRLVEDLRAALRSGGAAQTALVETDCSCRQPGLGGDCDGSCATTTGVPGRVLSPSRPEGGGHG